MAWAAAHIFDGPFQKRGKLSLFLRCKTFDHTLFIVKNRAVHQFLTLSSLGQDPDALAPPVSRIRIQRNKAFLFQPRQKSRYRRVAQLKFILDIPWAGLGIAVGKISHNVPLSSGQFHLCQRIGHRLIGTPVENANHVSVMLLQTDHPQKRSKLPIILSYTAANYNSLQKKFTDAQIFDILFRRGSVTMRVDCHMHMILDGIEWKSAIRRHSLGPDIPWIRSILQDYRQQGFTYLRDGGDRWGAGAAARELAPEYGITYRTPLAPLCKRGHYGGFIGKSYTDLKEYAALVCETRQQGGDFIKIMISGLMDFDRCGVLTEEGLPPDEIHELIHIAHEEGFAVMAHANGARTVEAAAAAGVDSVEHGAYLDSDALCAMKEGGTVWVPTLSTIGNLRGKGRFSEQAVAGILETAIENVSHFAAIGGLLAPGTDAGAWAVPHGILSEYDLLTDILGSRTEDILTKGITVIQQRF